MTIFKNLLLFLLAGCILSACTKMSHRKTPGGMPYQLFKGEGGKRIHAGDFIKVHITQKIQDSVYFTSEGKMPIYIPVNNVQPYDISETWTKLKVGDSIVAVQLMDTFINRKMQLPPHFKKGDKIMTYVKILDAFSSDSLVKLDEKKAQDEKLAGEIKFLEKYLADKKVNAQKTPSGAFVEIIVPGTGNLLDSGKYIAMNYTGTSFSGVKFDSNTDTSFHHAEPYYFTVGAGEMMVGFDEAIKLMRKDSKAKFYIPSMLGYGARPQTPLIKPFEHLMFDVEIVDVKDKNPNADKNVIPSMPKIDMPQPK